MKKTAYQLFIWLVLFAGEAMADSLPSEDISVQVQISGNNVIVDLSLVVPANLKEAWAVLTDFEHMAGFISNLKESKVIGTAGDVLQIYQRGSSIYGPVSFPYESTREIRLLPFNQIQSHMISGNMLKMEGTTLLTEEGGQTRIVYHADTIPGIWIPPVVGKIFIEHGTREQFQQMRNEIIKRKQAAIPSAPH